MTSALGGSITSPKSQNGRSRIERPAVVDVERAPAAVGALHPLEPAHAALDRRADARSVGMVDGPQRQHDLGGVVDVGVVDVGELERPAARLADRAGARPSRRVPRICWSSSQSAPRIDRLVVGGQPGVVRARSSPAHVSQTGDWQASTRRRCRRRIVKRSSPSSPRSDHRMVDAVPEQVQGDQRVHPGRLDAAPAPSASWRSTIQRSARASAARRSGAIGCRW